MAQQLTNLTRIHEDAGSIPDLAHLRIWHCHQLWCRLQTWLGSGIAVALVQVGSCSSDWTPSLRTSTYRRCDPKKSKKKKKIMQETKPKAGLLPIKKRIVILVLGQPYYSSDTCELYIYIFMYISIPVYRSVCNHSSQHLELPPSFIQELWPVTKVYKFILYLQPPHLSPLIYYSLNIPLVCGFKLCKINLYPALLLL